MEDKIICYICQDFKLSVGHETKWCPKNTCKRCGFKGHTQIGCMAGKKNLPLPDEIILRIFGYLDLKDLDRCARVSIRVRKICFDDSLKYKEFLSNDWMNGKFPKVHALNTHVAIPLPRSRIWHESYLPELRNCMVFRL